MGIVAKLRYLGTGFEYSIALAGGLVVTADDAVPEARFKPGDAAHAWWDVRDGVLVPVEDSVPDSEATQEGRP
jgi:hypothetical protein